MIGFLKTDQKAPTALPLLFPFPLPFQFLSGLAEKLCVGGIRTGSLPETSLLWRWKALFYMPKFSSSCGSPPLPLFLKALLAITILILQTKEKSVTQCTTPFGSSSHISRLKAAFVSAHIKGLWNKCWSGFRGKMTSCWAVTLWTTFGSSTIWENLRCGCQNLAQLFILHPRLPVRIHQNGHY